VTTRSPGDPWFTVFYRDPHRLWWAPGVFVALVILLGNWLLFDRSAAHTLAVATLMGTVIAGSAFLRRGRDRDRE